MDFWTSKQFLISLFKQHAPKKHQTDWSDNVCFFFPTITSNKNDTGPSLRTLAVAEALSAQQNLDQAVEAAATAAIGFKAGHTCEFLAFRNAGGSGYIREYKYTYIYIYIYICFYLYIYIYMMICLFFWGGGRGWEGGMLWK